jgi:hypothetical protein
LEKAKRAVEHTEGLNDRGAAKNQDKDWQAGQKVTGEDGKEKIQVPTLKENMTFIHCGSAPLDADLDPSFAKEVLKIKGEPIPNCILALKYEEDILNELKASGPLKNLWSFPERPHAFVFEVPKGKEIYSKDGSNPQSSSECAFPFKIDKSMIKAVYQLRAFSDDLKVRTSNKSDVTYDKVRP